MSPAINLYALEFSWRTVLWDTLSSDTVNLHLGWGNWQACVVRMLTTKDSDKLFVSNCDQVDVPNIVRRLVKIHTLRAQPVAMFQISQEYAIVIFCASI